MADTNDQLMQTIAGIIGKTLLTDPSKIDGKTTSDDINGWDSVTHSLLIMEIERELSIELPVDRVFDLENVGELVALVAGVISNK